MRTLFLYLSITLISLGIYGTVQAESSTETLTTPLPTAVKPGHKSLLLGFKSYNDTGRFEYLKDNAKGPTKGQTFNGKQEVFLGYKGTSGWGGYVQLTQYRYEFNDSSLNKWSVSDPSVSLIHPDLYNDGTLKVSGLVRTYIPHTDRSKNQNIRHYAYYSTQLYALGQGRDLFNQLIPRWFAAGRYNDGDTRFYVENRTVFTQKLNSWARWGIGNWLQMEQHAATATGYVDEVIPQFDFILNQNVFFGPRLSLPIFSQNSVYDGPRNATFEQARGELYFQATL